MGWWPFGKRPVAATPVDSSVARLAVVNEPVLAPRGLTSDEIRARKRAKAAGLPQPAITPDPPAARHAVLLRDGKTGKPKFARDPRTFPSAVQAAWKTQMTADEIKEYFG